LGQGTGDTDGALRALTRSRLACVGPVTAAMLAASIGKPAPELELALLALEAEGYAMRGCFTPEARAGGGAAPIERAAAPEWCERGLLARIHRYTLKRLRREIEPVTVADYQRFLFQWQGLGNERRRGVEAAAAVLSELQGLALPAIAWEGEILPARLADYAPEFLDQLTAAGTVVWLHPYVPAAAGGVPRRLARASAVTILPRSALEHWLPILGPDPAAAGVLSANACRVRDALAAEGALFFLELVQSTGLLRVQVEEGLGELAACGCVSADSIRGLRTLLTPSSRRRGFHGRARRRGADFDTAGRWALIRGARPEGGPGSDAIEHAARALLRRYGVVCRRALEREQYAPSWRDLSACYRAWEARGEIRGGRFVDGLGGEQFALSEAVAALRRVRRDRDADDWVVLAAADPLNLAGILTPGGRVAAVAGHRIVYRGGVPVASVVAGRLEWLVDLSAEARAAVRTRLEAVTRPAPRTRRHSA
jgi:ATP-dependent Lhr-like helicase